MFSEGREKVYCERMVNLSVMSLKKRWLESSSEVQYWKWSPEVASPAECQWDVTGKRWLQWNYSIVIQSWLWSSRLTSLTGRPISGSKIEKSGKSGFSMSNSKAANVFLRRLKNLSCCAQTFYLDERWCGLSSL